VAGRDHSLQRLDADASAEPRATKPGAYGMPYATSLRMGRLGYQSDAQSALAVSYNSLESYATSLEGALTQIYPPYEKIGVRNLGGEYNQLNTSLLQIENEFYGTIRPKRVIHIGERPLHALRERGVEYVEVRCMDLDPFVPVGIQDATIRFLDIFLLHCLLADSPPDTPQEIAEIGRNQHRAASHGREPGLELERLGQQVKLVDWAVEVLAACAPIAQALDAAHQTGAYTEALAAAQAGVMAPQTLPSARVLSAMAQDFGGSYTGFLRAHGEQTRTHLLALPWPQEQQSLFEAMASDSVAARLALEAADVMDFETYRQNYLSPNRLVVL
jgi:glutamate--cysteine ligase